MAIELCETHALRRAFGAKQIVLFLKNSVTVLMWKDPKTLAILRLTLRLKFSKIEVVLAENILAAKHKIKSTVNIIVKRKVQTKQNHKSTRHLISKANLFIKSKYFGSWVIFVKHEQLENENLIKLGYLHILGRRYSRNGN